MNIAKSAAKEELFAMQYTELDQHAHSQNSPSNISCADCWPPPHICSRLTRNKGTWPPPGRLLAASCPVLLHTYNNWAAAGRRRGGSGSSGASHHGSGVARLRLSTDLYRKCRRLAVCSPRSDTQPLLERIQCLQTTQFMQNYHYLQRWHYYLTRICFTLHFLLLDNSTGGGRPFALIRDGGIIFPINSSAPAGGSQTSLVVLSRST